MAITKSAKKAQRVSERRRVFNTRTKRTMKDVVKEATALVAGKKSQEVIALLPKVFQVLDKATKKGVIKANTAARIKSRLTKQVRVLSK